MEFDSDVIRDAQDAAGPGTFVDDLGTPCPGPLPKPAPTRDRAGQPRMTMDTAVEMEGSPRGARLAAVTDGRGRLEEDGNTRLISEDS